MSPAGAGGEAHGHARKRLGLKYLQEGCRGRQEGLGLRTQGATLGGAELAVTGLGWPGPRPHSPPGGRRPPAAALRSPRCGPGPQWRGRAALPPALEGGGCGLGPCLRERRGLSSPGNPQEPAGLPQPHCRSCHIPWLSSSSLSTCNSWSRCSGRFWKFRDFLRKARGCEGPPVPETSQDTNPLLPPPEVPRAQDLASWVGGEVSCSTESDAPSGTPSGL